MNAIELVTQSPEETRKLGERVGGLLADGAVLLLNGDLGAGKTTLTQGIAAGFGVREAVQSPTFTLVAEHEGGDGRRLHHLDLYRLQDELDLESFGYEQYIDPVDGISIIEWPERAGSWLPESYLLIDIAIVGPSERRFRLEAHGDFPLELSTFQRASSL